MKKQTWKAGIDDYKKTESVTGDEFVEILDTVERLIKKMGMINARKAEFRGEDFSTSRSRGIEEFVFEIEQVASTDESITYQAEIYSMNNPLSETQADNPNLTVKRMTVIGTLEKV